MTRGLSAVRPRPYPVATIGNFDGHHLGHQALLETVVKAARSSNGTAIVLTFDPHPVKVLAPHVDLRFLTSQEDKLARFEAAGIDDVIFLEFTESLAAMSPQEFVEDILYRSLKVKDIFVGQHFAFGKGRTGRIQDLEDFGKVYGFTVHPFQPVLFNGEVVSSTRIRNLIQSGRVREAAALLGRPYGIRGTVVQGRQQGQSLGWPTANIPIPPDRVIPADGVYAARATCEEIRYDAIVYIGTRPTFGAGERLIEVNLLDQERDLYGRDLFVQFFERLRGDHTFASPDELSAQIARDIEQAK
ncbi:bifunctional riboflavin kinase/FAD synthetase, partial [Petrachloros mirabilis]